MEKKRLTQLINSVAKYDVAYGKFFTNPMIIFTQQMDHNMKVEYLIWFMERQILSLEALNTAYSYCNGKYDSGILLSLDKYVPTSEFTNSHKDISYVMYPSRGEWFLSVVQRTKADKSARTALPSELKGLSAEKLNQYSDGLSWVHPSLKFASFKDEDAAKSFVDKFC